MSFSPFIKCICPACFEEIYIGECDIISGVTSNTVIEKGRKGIRARIYVERLDGPQYSRSLAQRRCYHCGYAMPFNIELVPSIILTIVGDTFSGKSHYIAALLHQVRNEWIANTGGFARMTSLTPEVETVYEQNYHQRLFMYKETIDLTNKARSSFAEPLIYKLTVSPSTHHPLTTVNLMIYDTSGEDFTTTARLMNVARFVPNTNAFIFVVDPFTIEPFFTALEPNMQIRFQKDFDLARTRSAANRFNVTIDAIERHRGLQSGSKLPDIPVAIMLSKSDMLSHFSTPKGYNFMINPRYSTYAHSHDLNVVSSEVRFLLEEWQQGELLAATTRFKEVHFFATSATGEPSDTFGNFKQVRPIRCLDPFLWILHKLGIIQAN